MFLMAGGWDRSCGVGDCEKKEQIEDPSLVESDIALNFYQGPLWSRCSEILETQKTVYSLIGKASLALTKPLKTRARLGCL